MVSVTLDTVVVSIKLLHLTQVVNFDIDFW